MDSISLKLIDRKGLLTESITYKSIFSNLETENNNKQDQVETLEASVAKWRKALLETEKQKALLKENLDGQIEITKNNKIKYRKSKVYFFGGGVAVGVVALALLL